MEDVTGPSKGTSRTRCLRALMHPRGHRPTGRAPRLEARGVDDHLPGALGVAGHRDHAVLGQVEQNGRGVGGRVDRRLEHARGPDVTGCLDTTQPAAGPRAPTSSPHHAERRRPVIAAFVADTTTCGWPVDVVHRSAGARQQAVPEAARRAAPPWRTHTPSATAAIASTSGTRAYTPPRRPAPHGQFARCPPGPRPSGRAMRGRAMRGTATLSHWTRAGRRDSRPETCSPAKATNPGREAHRRGRPAPVRARAGPLSEQQPSRFVAAGSSWCSLNGAWGAAYGRPREGQAPVRGRAPGAGARGVTSPGGAALVLPGPPGVGALAPARGARWRGRFGGGGSAA